MLRVFGCGLVLVALGLVAADLYLGIVTFGALGCLGIAVAVGGAAAHCFERAKLGNYLHDGVAQRHAALGLHPAALEAGTDATSSSASRMPDRRRDR